MDDQNIFKRLCDLNRQLIYLRNKAENGEVSPNSDIISTFRKDYWMPALKVLILEDGGFMSPLKKSVWINNELTSRCIGKGHIEHDSPNTSCTCGIYATGSLNNALYYIQEKRSTLVLLEPTPGSKVILGEKGWRAKSAFISEIISGPNKTVDADFIVALIKRAWNVDINLSILNDYVHVRRAMSRTYSTVGDSEWIQAKL